MLHFKLLNKNSISYIWRKNCVSKCLKTIIHIIFAISGKAIWIVSFFIIVRLFQIFHFGTAWCWNSLLTVFNWSTSFFGSLNDSIWAFAILSSMREDLHLSRGLCAWLSILIWGIPSLQQHDIVGLCLYLMTY